MIYYFQQLTGVGLVLWLILLLAFLVQVGYYLAFYIRILFWKGKAPSKNSTPPVSIIICAKNESENLKQFLPKVCEQDYPTFEVIVINDCSQDSTEEVLSSFKLKYPNLRYSNIEPDRKFLHGKKLAITIGLKAAQYEHILFIDADCVPVSPDWISYTVAQYGEQTKFVLGYGAFASEKTFLNKLIRFDAFQIAMQYMGFALAKMPYMGVGRNLSYCKSVYFNGKGFRSHYAVSSGDDDLFVNEHATGANTEVCLNPSAFTESVPATSFTQWSKQKQRHLTTSKYYKFSHKLLLIAEPFSRFLFFGVLVSLCIVKPEPIAIAIVYTLRMSIILTVIKLTMNKFNEKGFLLWVFLFDIILPFLHLFFIISNKFNTRATKWK